MASMESGQTRAASLMNAARRSHFVARIEKYEAKVRQAKAMMKEQKEAMAVADEQRPVFDTEEQQPSVAEKMVIPEKMVMPEQTALGAEQKAHRQHDRDLSHKHLERNRSQRKSHSQPERECSHEQALQQHERGFLSHEEAHAQHASEDSPGHKFFSEQKEIISGMLQRSSSSGMRTIMKGYDALGMATGLAAAADDKVFPMEIMPSDVQANIYIDLKPPPTSEVNIAAVAGALNVRIKAADMSTPMQEHAFRCARECLNSLGKLQSKRIAYTLKKEFDEVYGPAWHCIVGTSFGSYVTHSLGGFVYFSLDKVSVLLFKTTVEPIENS